MICFEAIREGIIRLHRHKSIIGLALISVILGKTVTVLEQLTQKRLSELLLQCVRLDVLKQVSLDFISGRIDSALTKLTHWEHLHLADSELLLVLVASGGFAAVLAFFNSVGLTAILRDLLVDQRYQARDIVGYGREYLIPFLRFKAPIYLMTGLLVAGLALSFLATDAAVLTQPFSGPQWIAIIFGYLFLILYYAFLSIGSKFIVTAPHLGTVELYRFTGSFLMINAREVATCYLILVSTFVGTVWAVNQIQSWALSFALKYGFAVFLLAYITAQAKIISFILFLRLRRVDLEADRYKSAPAPALKGL